ncbi:uncharacterized protein UDID_18710 [Ustilago sp. UG-2017a]|nr:uncharacterized protein UDID_18710 [Ustilago sp. UG-2017a]
MTAFDLSAASQDSWEISAALHDPDVLSSYTQDHTSQRAHFHDTFQLHGIAIVFEIGRSTKLTARWKVSYYLKGRWGRKSRFESVGEEWFGPDDTRLCSVGIKLAALQLRPVHASHLTPTKKDACEKTLWCCTAL